MLRQILWRWMLAAFIFIVMGAVLACNPNTAVQGTATSAAATITFLEAQLTPSGAFPTVSLSVPDVSRPVKPGQRVEIQFEVLANQGITKAELLVNNQIVQTDSYVPQPGAVFVSKMGWTPQEAGTFTLQMRVFNPTNAVGESNQILIEVAPEEISTATATAATPTPSPASFPTITPTRTRLVDIIKVPTITPSPTEPAGTPTPSYPYLIVRVQPGLNVRQGPSTRYPTVGLLLPGDVAEIRGQNNIGAGQWWQIRFDSAPNSLAWVSASTDYSENFNANNVPVSAAPPTPAPPSPTITPVPVSTVQLTEIEFRADRTQIQAGECVTVYWNVTNVKEVYYRNRGVPGNNQGRVECPLLTEFYELRVVRLDGEIESRTVKIEVIGTGYRTSEIDLGKGIDFDEDGKVSDEGDDFKWVKEDDKRVLRKWDGDDDIKLVPVGPASLDIITQEDCRWALDNLNDQDSIKPFAGLAACFRTDERRIGKLRFEDVDDDADIEWALWN